MKTQTDKRVALGLYNLAEACKYLGLYASAFCRLRRSGRLPYPTINLGGARDYYSKAQLDQMAETLRKPLDRTKPKQGGLYTQTSAAQALHINQARLGCIKAKVPPSVRKGLRWFWTETDLQRTRQYIEKLKQIPRQPPSGFL